MLSVFRHTTPETRAGTQRRTNKRRSCCAHGEINGDRRVCNLEHVLRCRHTRRKPVVASALHSRVLACWSAHAGRVLHLTLAQRQGGRGERRDIHGVGEEETRAEVG